MSSTPRDPIQHSLKSWPIYFEGLLDGKKTAEVRWNDRDFRERDTLLIREYDPAKGEFTGRSVTRVISRVDDLGQLLGKAEFVLLSFDYAGRVVTTDG